MSKEDRFKEITNEMYIIYKNKNSDYGSSVSDTYRDFGMISFLVRLSDKLNRLKTIYNKDTKVKDETIYDTLIDLANYSILAILELENDENRRV